MKICLIRPPRMMRVFSTSVKSSPAIGLAFIAGALKTYKHEITILDSIAEAPEQVNEYSKDMFTLGLTKEEIVTRIPADTELIGFSCMFTQDWLAVRELMDFVGESFPGATIIAGGEHITAVPEYSLRKVKHLKVCVLGEGEETIVELVKALEENRPLEGINGIAYKDGEGIHKNPRRIRVRDIDDIAYPAWEIFPMEKYYQNGIVFGVDRGRSLPILATRGCPYECTFCSSPDMWGKKYYMRDVTKLVDEIIYFKGIYNITNVDFYDLTAIINKAWIIAFCKELLDRNVNITWQLPSGTRTEVLDAEVAEYLSISGCKNLSYAPESGSPQVLNLIKKKVSLDNMIVSMRECLKHGLNIKLHILIGLPEEKTRDIFKTLWLILKVSWYGANDVAPSVFMAYPGSAIFTKLEKEGKIDMETDEYFHSMLDADNLLKIKFYNDNFSQTALRLYWLAALLLFYTSTFIFRPFRIYTFTRNIITQKYESRGEMALGELVRRTKFRKRTNQRKDQFNLIRFRWPLF